MTSSLEGGTGQKMTSCFSSGSSYELSLSIFLKSSTEYLPNTRWLNRESKRRVPSQIFPNFPILKERAIYENNCHNQDKRVLKDSCEKEFPTHFGLTPGLNLMTKQMSVYRFSMMLISESPSMLFDIVTTRFESYYNQNFIYDASQPEVHVSQPYERSVARRKP